MAGFLKLVIFTICSIRNSVTKSLRNRALLAGLQLSL